MLPSNSISASTEGRASGREQPVPPRGWRRLFCRIPWARIARMIERIIILASALVRLILVSD